MFTTKHLMLLAAGTALATGIILTQTAASNEGQSNKLEGVWAASMPGTPFHWTYIFVPTEPSGKRALLKGQFVVPIPAAAVFPQGYQQDYTTEFWGEAEMTGPNTFKGTGMWYGMKSGAAMPEIVNIGVDVFEGKFVGAANVEGKHYMAFYPANPTGIVTAVDTPFLVYPEVVPSSDTRMQILPRAALQK